MIKVRAKECTSENIFQSFGGGGALSLRGAGAAGRM